MTGQSSIGQRMTWRFRTFAPSSWSIWPMTVLRALPASSFSRTLRSADELKPVSFGLISATVRPDRPGIGSRSAGFAAALGAAAFGADLGFFAGTPGARRSVSATRSATLLAVAITGSMLPPMLLRASAVTDSRTLSSACE